MKVKERNKYDFINYQITDNGCIGVFSRKIGSKVKLPAILGWLIAGMLLGPHAFSLINQEILDAGWYQISVHVLECAVGLMIGTELVWNKIKKSEKRLL